MPLMENSDGMLWIEINEMNEVDEVQAKLVALGVRVGRRSRMPGATWPSRRSGGATSIRRSFLAMAPEPGVVVDPTQIPDVRALVLAVQPLIGPDRDPKTVTVLYLIEGRPRAASGGS